MATLHVLRVFIGDDGHGGNPLGVFLDGNEVPPDRRQAVAARLGFSETVFVDDAERGEVRIFTPVAELPFAGHPLVGAAWLLEGQGAAVSMLRPPSGEVPTYAEADVRWIRGRPEWAPQMELRQLATPADVDSLEVGRIGVPFLDAWAWEDEAAGHVRCRVFAPGVGIPEDEATGAAAVRLGHHLRRELRLRQGAGSVLHVRPGPEDTVEVGGRVALVEVREDAGR